jgi:DNA-binding response OmpR family regulator
MTHRILLVDDEKALRSLLGRALRLEDYEVIEAADGFEAWALARDTRFDLIVTDNRMPRLNGPAFIIRVQERYPTLPILRISGSQGGSEDTVSGVTTLHKPFEIDALLEVVRSVLANQKL